MPLQYDETVHAGAGDGIYDETPGFTVPLANEEGGYMDINPVSAGAYVEPGQTFDAHEGGYMDIAPGHLAAEDSGYMTVNPNNDTVGGSAAIC